jgi:hypothetical protein
MMAPTQRTASTGEDPVPPHWSFAHSWTGPKTSEWAELYIAPGGGGGLLIVPDEHDPERKPWSRALQINIHDLRRPVTWIGPGAEWGPTRQAQMLGRVAEHMPRFKPDAPER